MNAIWNDPADITDPPEVRAPALVFVKAQIQPTSEDDALGRLLRFAEISAATAFSYRLVLYAKLDGEKVEISAHDILLARRAFDRLTKVSPE